MTYYFSRVHFVKSTKLPIHIENWGFPEKAKAQPVLLEEYTYTNLKPNVGLTDADFDRRNKQYSF
jgi:hypothetical protein